jgi:hypothetical protein
VVVVEYDPDSAGAAALAQLTQQVPPAGASRQHIIHRRIWRRPVVFCVGGSENEVCRPGVFYGVGKAVRIKACHGISVGQRCAFQRAGVGGPVYADSRAAAHPVYITFSVVHSDVCIT